MKCCNLRASTRTLVLEKTMNKILTFVIFSIYPCAKADVIVATAHKVSPSALKSMTAALDQAGARPSDEQGSPIFFTIQNNLVLSCPPSKPDLDGRGCNLRLLPTTPTRAGEIGFSIRKPVIKALLQTKAAEASTKISSVDANRLDEHLHFGNPLYTPPLNSPNEVDYYCAPEGEAGKKSWECYLSVRETLTQQPSAK